MMTQIMLTSGEQVEAEHVRDDIYSLPGGRLVHTWVEDGVLYQDGEADEDSDEVTE